MSATPDSMCRQLKKLLRVAVRNRFVDFDPDALLEAATNGDVERFRALRKDAYVAMARAAWPQFVADMRAAGKRSVP